MYLIVFQGAGWFLTCYWSSSASSSEVPSRLSCGLSNCVALSLLLTFDGELLLSFRWKTFEVKCNQYFQQFPGTPNPLSSGRKHWNPNEMSMVGNSQMASETPGSHGTHGFLLGKTRPAWSARGWTRPVCSHCPSLCCKLHVARLRICVVLGVGGWRINFS